jgi:REP element-mobilizing transposase RayT
MRQTAFVFRSWGGKRAGAGRKPSAERAGVPHTTRPEHRKRHPVHVTLRVARGLPSLRRQLLFSGARLAMAAASRAWFRVLHFSVQSDHVHLLVEARDEEHLSKGMRGLAIRVALSVNRTLRRSGKVWPDRYHARALRTPREVRHGLVYVLANWKKHVRAMRKDSIDARPLGGSTAGRCRPPPPRRTGIRPTRRSGLRANGSRERDGGSTGSSQGTKGQNQRRKESPPFRRSPIAAERLAGRVLQSRRGPVRGADPSRDVIPTLTAVT